VNRNDTRTTLPVLAVDWGGTWIRVALVVDGQITGRARRRRPDALRAQFEVIAELAAQVTPSPGPAPAGVGVGVAGIVQHGSLMTAINLGVTRPTNVAAGIAAAGLLAPAFVVNDVQAAAIGVAQGWQDGLTAVISMGTGVGGAVIDRGRLLVGNGSAGDFGHTVVQLNGCSCPCGGIGCLETVVSGKALAGVAETLAAEGHSVLLGARSRDRQLHAGDLQDAASAGEPGAADALEHAAGAFGAGLRTVVAAVDPTRILLVGAALDPTAEFGRRVLAHWEALRPRWSAAALLHVPDDEDASLRGAALYAEQRIAGHHE
jgi:glucokinase